jgi:AraC-like DNA-binding protein
LTVSTQTARTRPEFPFPFRLYAAETGSAQVSRHDLGAVKVFRYAGSPRTVVRTRETIAAFDPGHFSLSLQLQGRCVQTQAGRVAILEPGEATTHDSSRPFAVQEQTPFELVVFGFPKSLLQPLVEEIALQAGARISPERGVATVGLPFLRDLADNLEAGTVAPDPSLGDVVLSVVAALYTPPAGRARDRRASGMELLGRIKEYAAANLHDPALAPGAVARANFVSTSYLYKLFKAEQTTFGEWLRGERLDRSRRDLLDPSLSHLRVTEIASRWGFSSPSVFSRSFRAAYGCSPRELRRTTRSS